eukprot:Gb_32931 [translate_table: standard]
MGGSNVEHNLYSTLDPPAPKRGTEARNASVPRLNRGGGVVPTWNGGGSVPARVPCWSEGVEGVPAPTWNGGESVTALVPRWNEGGTSPHFDQPSLSGRLVLKTIMKPSWLLNMAVGIGCEEIKCEWRCYAVGHPLGWELDVKKLNVNGGARLLDILLEQEGSCSVGPYFELVFELASISGSLCKMAALVETSDEDAALAVARFTAEVAWADAGPEIQLRLLCSRLAHNLGHDANLDAPNNVAEPQVLRICEEAHNLMVESRWSDLVSLLLTSADLIFSNSPEKDLDCIFAVICNLVTRAESPDEALAMAEHIATKVCHQPTDKSALRLRILFNLYNMLDHPYSKFLVYRRALKLAVNGKVADLIMPSFKKMDTFLREWNLGTNDQRDLFLSVSNILKDNKGSAKDSYSFLLKYLATFTNEDAYTLSEAKEEAVRAVIEFVKAPDVFQVCISFIPDLVKKLDSSTFRTRCPGYKYFWTQVSKDHYNQGIMSCTNQAPITRKSVNVMKKGVSLGGQGEVGPQELAPLPRSLPLCLDPDIELSTSVGEKHLKPKKFPCPVKSDRPSFDICKHSEVPLCRVMPFSVEPSIKDITAKWRFDWQEYPLVGSSPIHPMKGLHLSQADQIFLKMTEHMTLMGQGAPEAFSKG